MGPQLESITGRRNFFFTRPKMRWPTLSWPVNRSILEAGGLDKRKLHQAAFDTGFTLVGFHGTGAAFAASILAGVKDKSVTEARGKGFAVGSLYSGIPTGWARRKGEIGAGAFVLRIYVYGWGQLEADTDFDWGKMDPGDDVEKEGLEMVLRPHTFPRILGLPSVSAQEDQALLGSRLWKYCPRHSFRPNEMSMMERAASRLGLGLNELEAGIGKGGDVADYIEQMLLEARQAVADRMSLKLKDLDEKIEATPALMRFAFVNYGYSWYPFQLP